MAVVEVTDPLGLAEQRKLNDLMVLLMNRLRRLDDNMDLLYNALIPAGVRPLPEPAKAQAPLQPLALVTLTDLLKERESGSVNS